MSKFSLFRRKKRNRIKEIEPHEVFLDDLTQKKEEEFGVSQKRLEVPLSVSVLRFFVICVFLLFFVLLGRSFHLQFVEGEHYSFLATRNIRTVSEGHSFRGIVYDRNGEQLVYNTPRYNLYFKSRNISPAEKVAIFEVADILDEKPSKMMEKIQKNGEDSLLIKRNLSHDSLVSLQPKIDDLSGFSLSGSSGREYLYGTAFSHVLGYTGKIDRNTLRENPERYTIHDYIGKMGLEKYYEDYLSVKGEKIELVRDASGNVKAERKIEELEDSANSLVLTIDADLQKIAEEEALKKVEEIGTQKASIVALDPQTGEVLAMVNVPSFDSNIFQKEGSAKEIEELFQGTSEAFLNRVTSASYATGSVIKPLLAVAALEEGIISPEKKIHSPGYITIPNPWNPSEPTIFRDFQAHGWRDMREAIAVSSNVYFYAIGGGYEDQEGLGVSRIKKYLTLFGWNEKTGIDLPGEKEGLIPSPEWKRDFLNDSWYLGDTYNLSIGQGYLSTTPLQVANSYAAIINGGTLFSPRVVKKIIDTEGKTVKKVKTEILREKIAQVENLEIVKEGMKKATEIGTARSLQVLPAQAGAKTGTAQTSRKGINNNWVTVFTPYEDPEIVITILVEEVEGVTPVATHLARDILLNYFEEKDDEN